MNTGRQKNTLKQSQTHTQIDRLTNIASKKHRSTYPSTQTHIHSHMARDRQRHKYTLSLFDMGSTPTDLTWGRGAYGPLPENALNLKFGGKTW